ncbi:hypothetical protein ACQ4PT_024258 [Festuca glaucescens]
MAPDHHVQHHQCPVRHFVKQLPRDVGEAHRHVHAHQQARGLRVPPPLGSRAGDAVSEALYLQHVAPTSGNAVCRPPAALTLRLALAATIGSTSNALARRHNGTPTERLSASNMSRRRLVVRRDWPAAASTPHSAGTASSTSTSSASSRWSNGGELEVVGELHVSGTVRCGWCTSSWVMDPVRRCTARPPASAMPEWRPGRATRKGNLCRS